MIFFTQSKILQLATLGRENIVSHERSGAWVYYYINPNLPIWILNLLSSVVKEIVELYKKSAQIKIKKLGDNAFLKALYHVVLLEETARCTVLYFVHVQNHCIGGYYA